MKKLLAVLVFTSLCAFLFAEIKLSPLCQDTNSDCNCTLKDSKISLECHSITLQTVLNSENFAKQDNTTYAIDKLVLSHSHIIFLNGVFPNSSLKVLDLSITDIYNISDGVFQNLQEMEQLILSKNNIEYIDGNVFRGLRRDGQDYPLISIKELYLDNNYLHTLHSDIFQHIDRQLQKLYLGHNPFKVIDTQTLQAINSLVYLKELDLTYTGLKQLPPNFFHTPLYLENIDLSYNLFESVDILNLQETHALRIINLSGNPMVNLTQTSGFPNVTTIHTVHLCNMPVLEEVGPHSLSGLTSLEELYLSDNPKLRHLYETAVIQTQENSEVPFILKLKKLYIENNQLMHLNFSLDWNLLDNIDIRGNPWSCECDNEWLLTTLFPIIQKEDPKQAEELVCALPVQMEGKLFKDLYEMKSEMRCLDTEGNHPERDGTILVCILLGLLLGITLVLFCMYSYQRNWYGWLDRSPAAFSRQFYSRTKTNDNDLL